MTFNGFLSRLKLNGTNQNRKVHQEVPILRQRLNELSTQWCICGETRGKEEERSPGKMNLLSSDIQPVPERVAKRILLNIKDKALAERYIRNCRDYAGYSGAYMRR